MTIADAHESLVLRLATINDYKRQIDGVINKYYSIGLTVQPLIIVEGFSEVDIKGYYIYFDNTLLKLKSYIESIDICFKIFQVLALKYPQACHNAWLITRTFFF